MPKVAVLGLDTNNPLRALFFIKEGFLPLYKYGHMGYNTFRSKDMEAERELAKFLDKHLYTNNIFTRSDRTDDSATQVAGSDIILSVPSLGIKDAVVDEKASIYYINKDLRTFVLEISFLNKGLCYNEGWFVDETLSTEYYLLQWIKADIADSWKVKEDNITEIECVLISKAKLKKYFEYEGYNKATLLQIAQEMRATHKTMIAPPGKPYRFYFTQKLAEKPVNILLNKEEYIRLSEFHYFVRPNGDI